MEKQKIRRIIKKIFFLPPGLTLLMAIPSFGLVFYVLMSENIAPALEYFSYTMSAYAMIISITGIITIGKWMQPFARKVLEIPLVERYFSETNFRAEVSLYAGLLINLLYAGIKLFSGIYYASVWFGTLAVYYILLAIMRFALLQHVRKRGRTGESLISELKICRLCGVFLMLLDWALAGMIILVVRKNSGFEYPGTFIYAMALYVFYAVITAVRNVIKFRKYESPAVSTAKVINLTVAFVSMFSLETAMLTQFGADSGEAFKKMMLAMTGAGVSILVLGMAVVMIAYTTNQIAELKNM